MVGLDVTGARVGWPVGAVLGMLVVGRHVGIEDG
jgi:hypothetical protein